MKGVGVCVCVCVCCVRALTDRECQNYVYVWRALVEMPVTVCNNGPQPVTTLLSIISAVDGTLGSRVRCNSTAVCWPAAAAAILEMWPILLQRGK